MNRIILFTMFVVPHSVHGGLIGFEGIAPAGGQTTNNTTSFISDGFTFNQYHGHVVNSTFRDWNGTDWLENDSNRYLTFEKIDSSPFDLNSIDFGIFQSISGSTNRVITGNKFGGGTIQRTLTYRTGVATITFSSDWADLTSVRFENNPLGNAVVTWFALDNIQYDELSSVPEPTSLALFGWCTFALGFVQLRKRRMIAAKV